MAIPHITQRIAVTYAALWALVAATASAAQIQGQDTTAAPPFDPVTWAANDRDWSEVVEGFATQLAGHVREDGVGGAVAAITLEGEVVWSEAFGSSDPEAGRVMTTDAVFVVGSVTNLVTVTMLLKLVDVGVLELDDPVDPYLPELADVRGRLEDDPPVTFRHLASHMSGLERNFDEARAGPIETWESRLLGALHRTAFDTVPGERFENSPIGYGLLGVALQRATNTPFPELADVLVFRPLRMTGSTFALAGSGLEGRMAVGRPNRFDGSVPEGEPLRAGGFGYTMPYSGLHTTAEDLARLLAVLADPAVPGFLSPASRAELIAVQTPDGLDPPRPPGYESWPRPARFVDGHGGAVLSSEVHDPPQGLGVAIYAEGGERIIHQGGLVAGYTAHFALDPETRIGAVILRNYWRGTTDLGEGTRGLVMALNEVGPNTRTLAEIVLPVLLHPWTLYGVGGVILLLFVVRLVKRSAPGGATRPTG